MKSWKRPPQVESVSRFVECYWFLERGPDDDCNSRPKLNPDPSAHLIVSNADQPYRYEHGNALQSGQGSHWIFPHLKTFTMDHSSPFQIIGIKFRVGALYSVDLPDLPDPTQTIDIVRTADTNQLFGWDRHTADQLLISALEDESQLCGALDDALAQWMTNSHQDAHVALVLQALPLIGSVPIAGIGEGLHRSQRTVERSFIRVTGMTMKQVHCMNRLEEMLNHLHQLNDVNIDWARIAGDFGFSDQPHLIRYLKNSVGQTPAAYAKQRDLAIDIYGNFEFDQSERNSPD